jgi:hypothetical protein
MFAHQGRLLPKMGAGRRNHGVFSHPADAKLTGEAVDLAIARAEGAVLKDFVAGFDLFAKLSLFMGIEVAGLECHGPIIAKF